MKLSEMKLGTTARIEAPFFNKIRRERPAQFKKACKAQNTPYHKVEWTIELKGWVGVYGAKGDNDAKQMAVDFLKKTDDTIADALDTLASKEDVDTAFDWKYTAGKVSN
jgi:hypothetical protein